MTPSKERNRIFIAMRMPKALKLQLAKAASLHDIPMSKLAERYIANALKTDTLYRKNTAC